MDGSGAGGGVRKVDYMLMNRLNQIIVRCFISLIFKKRFLVLCAELFRIMCGKVMFFILLKGQSCKMHIRSCLIFRSNLRKTCSENESEVHRSID